MNMS